MTQDQFIRYSRFASGRNFSQAGPASKNCFGAEPRTFETNPDARRFCIAGNNLPMSALDLEGHSRHIKYSTNAALPSSIGRIANGIVSNSNASTVF